LGGTRAGSLRVVGGPTRRTRWRRARAHPDGPRGSADGKIAQYRAAWVAARFRAVAGFSQSEKRLGAAGRPGPGAGLAARPQCADRGGSPQGTCGAGRAEHARGKHWPCGGPGRKHHRLPFGSKEGDHGIPDYADRTRADYRPRGHPGQPAGIRGGDPHRQELRQRQAQGSGPSSPLKRSHL